MPLTSNMMKRYDYDKDQVIVTSKCPITKKEHSVIYPREGFNRWEGGELVQEALPDISSEDREFLISGVSPEGWKQMGSEEDNGETEEL